jgi:hypothetical protein
MARSAGAVLLLATVVLLSSVSSVAARSVPEQQQERHAVTSIVHAAKARSAYKNTEVGSG